MANWTASYGRYITLKVTATELNVSTANNTSQVRVQTSLYYGGGTTAVNGYPQTLSVSVNGTSIGTQTGITYNMSAGSTKTLNTYTSGNIAHGADGKKSVNVTVSITDNKGDNGKISQTLALTTIARASTPTLSASSIAIGSAVTINTNRASSSFTHTATFKFGSLTKTITTKNTNASFTYTPTNDLATQVPNSSSGSGTITLTTYSGTTAIGSKTIGLTVTVPSNSTFNPTITAPTVSEGVADVTTKVGAVYVQGKSKFVVKATPTTRGGATVKSVVFTVKTSTHTGSGSGSGKQYSATTATLTGTGAHAISVKVTDSRNRTATASIATAPSVLAYSPPKITAFTVKRRAGASTTVDVARTVTYNIVGTNTVNVKIDRLLVGSTTVTNVQNVNLTTGTSNNVAPTAPTGNADASSYKFTITVTDKFSAATSSITIPTAGATMSWGKNGISVGGIYNNAIGGALQVSGKSTFDDAITMNGGIESIYIPANSNLNNYQKPGFYYNHANTEVAKIANTPENSSFSLLVEKHAGIKQTFTIYTHQLPHTYVRNMYNNSWGDWKQVDIVEIGSNSNGHFYKYTSGVLICFKSTTISGVAVGSTWGSIYVSNHHSTGNWAHTFIGSPFTWHFWKSSVGNAWLMATVNQQATPTLAGDVQLLRGTSGTASGYIQTLGIGRWK